MAQKYLLHTEWRASLADKKKTKNKNKQNQAKQTTQKMGNNFSRMVKSMYNLSRFMLTDDLFFN